MARQTEICTNVFCSSDDHILVCIGHAAGFAREIGGEMVVGRHDDRRVEYISFLPIGNKLTLTRTKHVSAEPAIIGVGVHGLGELDTYLSFRMTSSLYTGYTVSFTAWTIKERAHRKTRRVGVNHCFVQGWPAHFVLLTERYHLLVVMGKVGVDE